MSDDCTVFFCKPKDAQGAELLARSCRRDWDLSSLTWKALSRCACHGREHAEHITLLFRLAIAAASDSPHLSIELAHKQFTACRSCC